MFFTVRKANVRNLALRKAKVGNVRKAKVGNVRKAKVGNVRKRKLEM